MTNLYHITFTLLAASTIAVSTLATESVATPGPRSGTGRELQRGVLEAVAQAHADGGDQLVHRKASFSGGWHGSLILARSTCSGFAPNFLFRHVTSIAGNRATLRSSHDGTLIGTTRDKGRRLEVARRYSRNDVQVTATVVYLNVSDTAVDIGLGVELRGPRGTCSAIYAGKGVRAF